jgi:3-hydroxyisobutyrate dehydrogenase-like beta-hydroxyacid dehydrogenase
MGAAVGKRLTGNGLTVLTMLDGRSAESVKRANAAGMMPVAIERIVDADIVLSIVPPGEALGVAKRLASVFVGVRNKPLYVDCNAVNPRTVETIASVLAEVDCPFVDAGIIGGPPKPETPGPTFYLSGERASDVAGLAQFGLKCEVLSGPIGAASALKMSYGGITKGLTALGSVMILAAARNDMAEALHRELEESQPMLLAWFERQIPSMFSKAYRWVAEMDEVAAFVGGDAPMFDSAAKFYERLAADDAGARVETNTLSRFLA